MAGQAQPAVRDVLERIPASPVVQADETGWRYDWTNGYVWTLMESGHPHRTILPAPA